MKFGKKSSFSLSVRIRSNTESACSQQWPRDCRTLITKLSKLNLFGNNMRNTYLQISTVYLRTMEIRTQHDLESPSNPSHQDLQPQRVWSFLRWLKCTELGEAEKTSISFAKDSPLRNGWIDWPIRRMETLGTTGLDKMNYHLNHWPSSPRDTSRRTSGLPRRTRYQHVVETSQRLQMLQML